MRRRACCGLCVAAGGAVSVRERAEQLRLTERAGARAEQLQVHEQLLHIEAEQCASVAQWKSRPDAP